MIFQNHSSPVRSTRRTDAAGAGGRTVQGLPPRQTAVGRITAIDLNKGEILWQVAHGETPDWSKG